jgi:hypothetical protein
MKKEERIARMAEVARANPGMSIRQIEAYLGLKPENNASAFRKGTQARENEERDYRERLAMWRKRFDK